MTIIIKDYEFEETEEKAFVEVKIRGITAKKADTFACETYIKVNCTPYLFEADLAGEIEPDASTVFIGGGRVKFELQKANPGLWHSLIFGSITKEERLLRRKQSLKISVQKVEMLAESKRAEANLLIQKQIEVEREAREKLAALKAQEKEHILVSQKKKKVNVLDGHIAIFGNRP
ncbi:hypothetical protein BC829DRAFT_361565 [Chytridium lagenaria]|nr:hypothetical protein BC829DRAFT_361565 [Chytridium lagenaria]